MSIKQRVHKFLSEGHKLQKVYNKIKNIPYMIRCAQVRRFVIRSKLCNGISQRSGTPQVVVSLTSYLARFDSIYYCLKSLLLQTVKPDAIILWLDCPLEEVPSTILDFQLYGITIRCGVEDLKPHKKYYFAMQQYPDAVVVTVDDDVFYPPTLLESLLQKHQQYPDCVCARRVHKMTLDNNGRVRPYGQWLDKYKKELLPSYLLVPTGVGGVLYPPHCLDQRVFDKQMLCDTCLMADDIWLKWMELLHGTKVVWVPNNILTPPCTEHSQETSLYLSNVHQNKNDGYIAAMQNLFGQEVKDVLQRG